LRSRLFLSVFVLCSLMVCMPAGAAPPQWIWTTPKAAEKAEAGDAYFRKLFQVAEPESGELEISADNRFEVFVNGRNVGAGEGWNERTKYNISPLLTPGRNLIAVHAKNDGADPAGLMVRAVVKSKGKPAEEVVTDASWKFATKVGGRFAVLDFDDSKWEQASALGEYGKAGPWGAAGPVVAAKEAPLPSGAKSQEKGLFELRDGDRVVLLGGTFIERLQADGYFEAALTTAMPNKNITYRNLGWSGDTVWGDSRGVFGTRADGFKRLVSDVALCKPTVIVVCYGQNEAYAGEAGLTDFEQGLGQLIDALEPTGARIVLLTPPPREAVGPAAKLAATYNKDLGEYCKVIQHVASQRGHAYADLFAAMQNREPQGAAAKIAWTENGQHFTPYGHWKLAPVLSKVLGAPVEPWQVEIDLKKNTLDACGTAVSDLKVDDSGLSFTATNRTATREPLAIADYPTANFKPGMLQSLVVKGLKPGSYEVRIDGQQAGGALVDARGETTIAVANPSATNHLRATIAAKNELFFNRYRPQNETYLFLFRKHEQGNNAVEIPMFDPLIEEKEKQIAELRQPLKQKFELVRVKE
jgi:hypothetical protein